MTNYLQTLTPQGRTIVTIIVIVVVVIVSWVAYKEIRNAVRRGRAKKDPKVVVTDAEDNLKAEEAKGETISYPSSAYSSAANAIKELLDGCETATSELVAIKEVVKVVKKPIDWYNLVKVFGVKEVDNCGPWSGSTQYDLPTLLKDQLDSALAYWNINEPNWKDSGYLYQDSALVLEKYLQKVGVTF